MNAEIEKKLTEHGIRPTAVRNMLVEVLDRCHGPVSAQQIEIELDTVDRSTISRSLALFVETGLLHVIDDGTGIPKYESCPSHHHHLSEESHAHFHCRNCGATICLESVPVPQSDLPEGYMADKISYIITGLCPKCSD